MATPPTEAELPVLPVEMLTEILLRISTPADLVHAAATSKSWRAAAVANPEFLASYRERQPSSTFLGIYVPRQFAGPPSFHMADSIRLGDDDARDLKAAARRSFDYGEIRRYQDHRLHDDAFIPSRLGIHPDCRLLDCHNSRLLLTRGEKALEVRSPLARESILLPFPPDVVDPYCLQACLLHGHDKAAAASFRVVYLQHRRLGHSRQARAVEYDSRRKSWQDHPWETIKSNIEGTPEEVMHAGHRIFCKYTGLTSAALVLDTNNMQFSVLPLPNYQNFTIGEIEDNVCCFVEADGCTDHRLKVWQLDEEKLHWDLKKDIKMDQVLGEHVGYYRPCVVSNGIALVCSRTTHRHFVVDLKTFSMKEEFEFHGQSAYPMQMPWPPVFSDLTANAAGGFDRDGGPASVVDTRTGVGLSDWIAACTQKLERNTKAIADAGYQIAAILQDLMINAKAIADAGYQIAAILQDLKINAKAIVAAGSPFPACRVYGGLATNGFDDGGLAKLSVGDPDANARTGVRESEQIDDPSPGPSVGGCIGTDPLPEAKKARQLLHSSSIACFVSGSSTAPPTLMASTAAGTPICPHQGRKQAGSRQSKGSPKAMGSRRRSWKRKPKYLKAMGQRKRHLFSIASKISDEVQIATSSCREASAASTAAVSTGGCKLLLGGSGSTFKFIDVGKQPIIDVSITSAPSLSDPSAGESAEQRGEAAQDSNGPQDLDIQDPTATAPTSAATEQCFGKDKNYVPNHYLIPESCDQFSDLMNPKDTESHHPERSESLIRLKQGARCHSKYCVKHPEVKSSDDFLTAGGFDRDAGPASVGDARTGSGESDTIEDLFRGTLAMVPPAAVAVEPEELLVWRSQSPFCVQNLDNDLLLQPPALASCPRQGRKRADSRETKGSPEAKGPGRRNWNQKPKYLEAIFALRRHHSFSIASKISDEVQIATSSCREASAATTAAVSADECKHLLGGCGSTFKFTDVGKQPIIDVSITSAPSLSNPSAGESAEQRGEVAQDSNEPQDLNIQDPTATAPTSATAEQCFGKDKNYIPNDCLIPESCDQFSDLVNPKGSHHLERSKSLTRLEQGARRHSKYCVKHPEVSSNAFLAAGGFDRDAGPASVGDARTGSGDSDTIADLFGGTLAMPPPAAPAVEPEEPLVWRSRSPFCVQSLDNDLLLQPPALACCPQQGRKRANSGKTKGSPEAKGPGRRNWNQKPKYLEAIFALRRHHSFSIASKISDEAQIATSSCRQASATSTAAVGSTIKFTDSGKQPIIDVSITSAPSPEARENNQSLAEQSGEAGRGKGSPEATGRGRRERMLNPKYIGGDWVVR